MYEDFANFSLHLLICSCFVLRCVFTTEIIVTFYYIAYIATVIKWCIFYLTRVFKGMTIKYVWHVNIVVVSFLLLQECYPSVGSCKCVINFITRTSEDFVVLVVRYGRFYGSSSEIYFIDFVDVGSDRYRIAQLFNKVCLQFSVTLLTLKFIWIIYMAALTQDLQFKVSGGVSHLFYS